MDAAPNPRDVEFEFGTPIPGRILPECEWVRTALKKLPPPGPLHFAEIFGRSAPVVLDIGCGNGRFTLASALRRPDWNHLATDVLPAVIRYATRRANQRGLSGTRFAVIGGVELLRDYVETGSISEIHVYHPQPYYERREIPKRLIRPRFLAMVHRALLPRGLFVLQTDNPHYADYMRSVLSSFFDWREQVEPWPDAPEGRTRREILARSLNLPIFRAVCSPIPTLTETDLAALVDRLPQPKFNADRALQKIDQLESRGEAPSDEAKSATESTRSRAPSKNRQPKPARPAKRPTIDHAAARKKRRPPPAS